MKTFRRHIILVFMLSLVLLYSTPIKSLHNCSNLNHHSSELAFEAYHGDCLICSLQYYPYIPTSLSVFRLVAEYDAVFNTSSYTGSHYCVYSNSFFDGDLRPWSWSKHPARKPVILNLRMITSLSVEMLRTSA